MWRASKKELEIFGEPFGQEAGCRGKGKREELTKLEAGFLRLW